MENHFDVSRIIGIKIIDKRLSRYEWLPEKQKTTFFGLIKRNSYHSEGYYYLECYESGHPSTRQQVIEQGYLIDSDNVVWHRPYVTVYLEHEYQVNKNFVTFEEALQWADELKATSGKTFEIVKYD